MHGCVGCVYDPKVYELEEAGHLCDHDELSDTDEDLAIVERTKDTALGSSFLIRLNYWVVG